VSGGCCSIPGPDRPEINGRALVASGTGPGVDSVRARGTRLPSSVDGAPLLRERPDALGDVLASHALEQASGGPGRLRGRRWRRSARRSRRRRLDGGVRRCRRPPCRRGRPGRTHRPTLPERGGARQTEASEDPVELGEPSTVSERYNHPARPGNSGDRRRRFHPSAREVHDAGLHLRHVRRAVVRATLTALRQGRRLAWSVPAASTRTPQR
jgi:hypothetical protein